MDNSQCPDEEYGPVKTECVIGQGPISGHTHIMRGSFPDRLFQPWGPCQENRPHTKPILFEHLVQTWCKLRNGGIERREEGDNVENLLFAPPLQPPLHPHMCATSRYDEHEPYASHNMKCCDDDCCVCVKVTGYVKLARDSLAECFDGTCVDTAR